jgi:hypothetical protein
MARGRRARPRAFDIPQQIPPRMARRFGLSSFRTTKKAEVISTGQSCKMSEWPIKPSRKLADFQAEYEGSILFTRSNVCLGGCFDAQCHATA